jgi:hypothetical protein
MALSTLPPPRLLQGATHDLIDQLGLQHATEVAVLGEGDERAAPVRAHGLGLSMAGHCGPERRSHHGARRRVSERVTDDET